MFYLGNVVYASTVARCIIIDVGADIVCSVVAGGIVLSAFVVCIGRTCCLVVIVNCAYIVRVASATQCFVRKKLSGCALVVNEFD